MSSGIRVSTWISPDLVAEILLGLPAKSLLRFRLVSKSLCAEIDSSDFVKAHLKRSIESKIRFKLIIRARIQRDLRRRSAFYAADFDDGLEEAVVLNNPFELLDGKAEFLVSGTCNGLILLGKLIYFRPSYGIGIGIGIGIGVEQIWEFFLWNPFTRQYKKLPSRPYRNSGSHYVASGLGYDSASDDYKVVAITYSAGNMEQLLVYSLRSDSWRMIQHDFLSIKSLHASVRGRWVDGSLYWINRLEKGHYILGFDLSKEVLFELPFLSEPGENNLVLDSVVLDGNMYVAEVYGNYNNYKTREFYLWVSDKGAKNSAAAECWRKAFEMDEYRWPFDVLCSKKGNDDMLLVSKDNSIFWYGLKGRIEERVRIQGLPDADYYICNVCLESLVSLGKNSVYDGDKEQY